MSPPVVNLMGQVFGRLTVIAQAPSASNGRAQWLCKCECGKESVVRSWCLRRNPGGTRSCGCLKSETNKGIAPRMNEGRKAKAREALNAQPLP